MDEETEGCLFRRQLWQANSATAGKGLVTVRNWEVPVQGGTLASKAEAATGAKRPFERRRQSHLRGGFVVPHWPQLSAFLLPFAIIPSVAGEVRLVLRRLARPSWGSSGADLKFCQSAAAVHAGSCTHQLVRG
jgi:hypothetical protein